jgi:hypothetical protein
LDLCLDDSPFNPLHTSLNFAGYDQQTFVALVLLKTSPLVTDFPTSALSPDAAQYSSILDKETEHGLFAMLCCFTPSTPDLDFQTRKMGIQVSP